MAADPKAEPYGAVNAICYSGYRSGQSPDAGVHPTYAETKEDLLLLVQHGFALVRLYDCNEASQTALEVIAREGLPLKAMLGAWLAAEVSNPACPWGGTHPQALLEKNRVANAANIERLIALAQRYPAQIHSLSAGNEATVDWTDHLVPEESVLRYVRRLKAALPHPVTFCENYLPWLGKLDALAAEVDFISLHTYPAWEQKTMAQALPYTEENYDSVARRYPGKPVVITEAGWATRSNGRGIPRENASEGLQQEYYRQLVEWSRRRGVLTFVFEAFDEPWKGSDDPAEPEKHWGLFTVGRRPKMALLSAG
jgi:exo-beta-1,3-glucanase (GH17 family)